MSWVVPLILSPTMRSVSHVVYQYTRLFLLTDSSIIKTVTTTSYVFYTMLENSMSLVAVNLPSLWRLCTSVIPEKIAGSIHSMTALFSMRNSSRTVHATRQMTMDSNDSIARPSASAASSDHLAPEKNSFKIRNEMGSHTCKIYTLNGLNNMQNERQMGDMSTNAVYVQDTVELHHL